MNAKVHQQSVDFWNSDLTAHWRHPIPLLCPEGKQVLGRDWPHNGPAQSKVIEQLAQSTRSWTRLFRDGGGKLRLQLVVSHYLVAGTFSEDADKPRIWLGHIEYVREDQRRRAMTEGVQVAHQGVKIVSPRGMGALEEQSAFFNSGEYVRALRELVEGRSSIIGSAQPDASSTRLTPAENDIAEALGAFIEAEYEMEEQKAQQEPSFVFSELKARSTRSTRRQAYQVTLTAHDHERLKKLNPSLLAPADSMGLESHLRFEVTDTDPEPGKPLVNISIERQTDAGHIPQEGELLLSTVPTLKKVRLSVLEQLQEQRSSNRWLLPALAGEYRGAPARPASVSLPESKFPPTASQKKAIEMGAGTEDYALVLGPPGTGKTTVILSWVRHFVAQGKRVLVTSQSNKAVDNVLEKLVEEDTLECVRLGNEDKISSTLEDAKLENKLRSIQSGMFATKDQSLADLQRVETYLTDLGQKKKEIARAAASYRKLSEKSANAQQRLKTAHLTYNNAARAAEDQARRVEANAQKRKRLLTPTKYRLLEPFRRLWVALPLLAFLIGGLMEKRKLKRRHKELYRCRRRSDKAQATVDDLQGKADESRQRVNECFSGAPDTRLDGVELPTPENFDPEQVQAQIKRCQRLREDVERWFEQLSKEHQGMLRTYALEHVDVVGATCIGINTKPEFRDLHFDVVIVDEAGQIQPHNLIVPLSRAPQAILVGDHKQLPPVVQEEIEEEIESRGQEDNLYLYRKSWFEVLWEQTPADRRVMLDTQFRCPRSISDYVSRNFYDGQYYAGSGMEKKQPLFSFTPGPMVFIDTAAEGDRYEKSAQQDGRNVVRDNPLETELVVSLLERALKEKPELASEREIGIIVPYANHVKALEKAIGRARKAGRLKELNIPLSELVASVDSFQGQERELILFPFSRSNKRRSVGFLADWRRLNVAQTRAKAQLIMIGDSGTLAAKPRSAQSRDAEFKRAMRNLVATCQEDGCLLPASRFRDTTGKKSNGKGSRGGSSGHRKGPQQHRNGAKSQPTNAVKD